MTSPPLAVTRPDGTRRYVHPITGEEVPSVTTIIKHAFPKPKVTEWAARKSAEYAVAHWKELDPLPVMEKVDRIRLAHEVIRDEAANIGDAVHETVDAWSRGEVREITKGTNSYLNQFIGFIFDVQPKFLENEVTLWSRRYQYAGTADAIIERNGEIWLIDIKSGKRVYEETALQLSALAGCDFIIRSSGEEEEIPALDVLAALHIRPRSWKLIPITSYEKNLSAFLAAREVFRWSKEVSPYVLGEAA